jgi:hypothetical protein
MNNQSAAVHRTIVVVDVEGFGDRRRTNQNQLAIREGLYLVMREAFRGAGISWIDHYYEDRGDGMFLLVGPEVPKSVFIELLPYALLNALRTYNSVHQDAEQIRLRMALHAGEVNYDEHGVTSSSINFTFRLIASDRLRKELTQSLSVLAIITSEWFFEEVVRHSAAPVASYRPVKVIVKETETLGWMYFPDYEDRPIHLTRDRSIAGTVPRARSTKAQERASECREALTHYYRAALTEPITPAEGMPIGLEVPTLEEGYIDHRIRVAEVTSSSDPGRESWWIDAPVYEEARPFLTGLLSSNTVLKAPLILLGHPGSGKSILTRILAGSLPATDFLLVRIELRKVPVEADLQQIIEYAVRGTTGESIHWPQLVETARGARPVVILDGFDELLQATGVMHNDFLTDVQEFQKREHSVGRPLAFIVTSRIAVTDRALIPYGSTVIKLEPFNEDQIRNWLGTWARANQIGFSRRGLTPLPAKIALNYRELAEQPLLLLMLALYDADENVLQHRSADLGRTELYASLLKDFASREISRQSSNLSTIEFEHEVEHELLRLSIAAFSMFNRRSQWVRETDLDADLSVLLSDSTTISNPIGKRPRLTAAQLTFGRFFFIHESRAVGGGGELRTYEFLHSTFGEFLVARLVVRILGEMASVNGPTASQSAADIGSEDMLRTLLSFAALTARSPIVIFMNDLLDQLNEQRRAIAVEMLLRLHARALFSRDWSVYRDYEPIVLRATERYAAWSVNLVVLAVLVGGEITSSQLYPEAADAVNEWRKEVMIWRSQLSGYGWEELHEAIALERVWDGQRREIRLRLNDGTFNAGYPGIFWMYNMPVHGSDRDESFVDRRHNSAILLRKINFICNMSEDILTHSLEPAISLFPAVANVFVVIDDRTVSAAHAFIAALYAPYGDSTRREVTFLDLARVAVKLVEVPDMDYDASYLSAALVVLVSAVEKGIASPSALEPFARIRENVISPDSRVTALLARLDDLLSSSGPGAVASQDDKD